MNTVYLARANTILSMYKVFLTSDCVSECFLYIINTYMGETHFSAKYDIFCPNVRSDMLLTHEKSETCMRKK